MRGPPPPASGSAPCPCPRPPPLDPEALAAWPDHLAEVAARLRPVCPDVRTHGRALAYLEGLLGPAARKNSWQLAEARGEANLYAFQHLLGRAAWSPEAARDALCAYVAEHLGHADGVAVVDETGFLKQGMQLGGGGAAVQRHGRAHRELPDRGLLGLRRAAGPRAGGPGPVPAQGLDPRPGAPAGGGAGPRHALRHQAGASPADAGAGPGGGAAGGLGDGGFGLHLADLRQELEARGQSYVLAVAGNEHVWFGWRQVPVGDLWAALPEADWETLACGLGAKGPRVYDWQCWVLAEPEDQPWGRYLLFRWSCTDPADGRQAYLVYAARPCALETLVAVADTRWCIESAFEAAKQETGAGRLRGAQRHRLAAPRHAGSLGPGPAGRAARDHAAGGRAPARKKSPGSLATFKRSRGLASA